MMITVSRRAHFAAALLLGAHASLLAWAATRHSPSVDEVGHMAAGFSHWQLGTFDLYRVNPPLVRLVAAAPIALLNPRADWTSYATWVGGRGEFVCGMQFVSANGERSRRLFAVARWACIPFSLLGGWTCYRWASELYGARAALISLTLWCFSPNVLAHAQMITPDVGATALGTLAVWLFWRWLRSPSFSRAIATGLALGLAELTKATFLVFYAIWPLAWAFWRMTGSRKEAAGAFHHNSSDLAPSARRQAAQLLLMAALSVYVINLGYGFEDSLKPLGDFNFVSETLGGAYEMARPESLTRNRFASTPLAGLRIPLPGNYVQGIDQQKHDFEQGYKSYLRGEWRHGGWWYYYLYGLAVKVPLGTWLLFVLALAGALYRNRRRCVVSQHETTDARADTALGTVQFCQATWRDEFVLLLPAAVILAFVSSQTGFNHHLRYVLPIFPFVFIWIGRLGRPRTNPASRWNRWLARPLIALSLAWSIGSSLWYYPHSLSYFNELAGGPLGGRWHLLDSNLDWGQDLYYLKSWLDDHPQAKPLGLAYFGYFDPRAAGIEFTLPPQGPASSSDDDHGGQAPPAASGEEFGPQPGWYAVSVMMLEGYEFAVPDGQGGSFYADEPYFSYFNRFEPIARAGYSIYIYHLESADVSRVRRDLGLPLLKSGNRNHRYQEPK